MHCFILSLTSIVMTSLVLRRVRNCPAIIIIIIIELFHLFDD